MLMQTDNDTVNFIIWLIIGTIILGIFIYLAVRFIVSKTKANDKKIMCLIIALIGLLVIPLISGIIGTVLTLIGSLPETISGANYMGQLVPIIQYLLFLIVIKFLLDEDWGTATWISLIALFLLFFLYSCFPILYTYLGSVV